MAGGRTEWTGIKINSFAKFNPSKSCISACFPKLREGEFSKNHSLQRDTWVQNFSQKHLCNSLLKNHWDTKAYDAALTILIAPRSRQYMVFKKHTECHSDLIFAYTTLLVLHWCQLYCTGNPENRMLYIMVFQHGLNQECKDITTAIFSSFTMIQVTPSPFGNTELLC